MMNKDSVGVSLRVKAIHELDTNSNSWSLKLGTDSNAPNSNSNSWSLKLGTDSNAPNSNSNSWSLKLGTDSNACMCGFIEDSKSYD
jgi:hypothetical protein